MLFGTGFHVIEAADKLLIGAFKGVFGIYLVESGCIDEAEQQVAELGLFLLVGIVAYG